MLQTDINIQFEASLGRGALVYIYKENIHQVLMFNKCLFALAVLGSSTCDHHHGHDYYPSHPPYPPYSPSQADWSQPGHGHPYGAHPPSWNFPSRFWQHVSESHNPSGGGHMSYNYNNEQWPHKPSEMDDNTGQWPQKPSKPYNPSQTGFNGQDKVPDHQLSDDASGSENVPSKTADQLKNPFIFDDQDSGSDLNESGESAESEENGQDGTLASQTDYQAKNPFDFNNEHPNLNNNQNDKTSETERIGQSGNVTSLSADRDSKPFEFNSQETDTLTLNREDIPSESSDINQDISNITITSDSINNQNADPVLEPTNETNKTLSLAFITGPNDPYTSQVNVTSKQSEKATLQPNQAEGLQPASVRSPDDGIPINGSPDVRDIPTEPAPIIGSEPVPFLEQFLAPSLQWHVGIYTKTATPYAQICGGSLVKTDVVLTAAHCFWSDDEGALRPALFAAAAGKLQRAWDASSDAYAQRSDIREIHIPPRFRGAKTSFQDDIAVARLSALLRYAPGVQPACVDFGLALEREQLQSGREGTVVGWGLTEPNGPPSERLNVLALAYLDIEQCIARAHPSFLKYITSDKICAGDSVSGKAACRGDSGGGLVFTDGKIPYIRGIASTAYRSGDDCNAYTPATFTLITFHSTFLADHVPNIAEDCRTLYTQVNTSDETEGSTLVTTDAPSESISTDSSAGNVESGQLRPNVTIKVHDGGKTYALPVPLPLTTGNAT